MSDSLSVISFSLYGTQRLYCEGALRNTELALIHYPGWICRFYLDDSVPHGYQTALTARGAQVIKVTKPTLGPMYGRYWRFWVAADRDVSRFIVRDADSRLNERERAAVDDWVSSGKTFHIMRDSVHHKTRALAGMWGGIGGRLPKIEELVDGWGRFDKWGQNDQFVSEILFPLMQDDYVCHDGAGYFDDGRPFPAHAPLSGTRYVGEVVDDDRPRGDIWRESAELENWLVVERDRTETLTAEIGACAERLKASKSHSASQSAKIEALAERLRTSETDRALRSAEIDTLTTQLGDAQAEVTLRASQITDLAGQLETFKIDSASKHAQINHLMDELKLSSQSNIELKRKFDKRTKALERELWQLKQSTSWRVTKPLRAAKTFVVQFRAPNK